MSMGLWWKYWWGKVELCGEKLAPLALCQPGIVPGPLQLTWHCPLWYENHTNPTNKLCGQDVELINITTCDKCK
jgi:hypothetical protein